MNSEKQFLLHKFETEYENDIDVAVEVGDLELIKGLNLINFTNSLYIAAREGYLDLVKYIYDHGGRNEYALSVALKFGNLDVVRWFLENKISYSKSFLQCIIDDIICDDDIETFKFIFENIEICHDSFEMLDGLGDTECKKWLQECHGFISEWE